MAIPCDGLTLYRLVTHDPVERDDFEPVTRSYADRRDIPELFRLGLSHFTSPEFAAAYRWKDEQRIAVVPLPQHPRIHVARTDRDRPGHVEVWIPRSVIDELLREAHVLD